jgi:hypothetical protein
MKFVYLFLFFICTLTRDGRSQHSTFSTQYTINFPLAPTKSFIGTPSFRGFTLDYRYHSNETAFGLSTGWYVFYEEKDAESYTTSNGGTFWGKQFRYINSVPILLTASYTFTQPEKLFAPFFTLGFGTTYNRVEIDMNQYKSEDDTWHFTLAPEVGVELSVDMDLSARVSARYNNNFAGSDVGRQAYLGLNVALTYVY